MARSLASIKEIKDLLPITGKDKIELAIIDGWQVIVKKGEYKIGDKTIYIEIDSLLPEIEDFEFLRKNKFRIKTIKMGGVLSQGICFPISILKNKESKYKINQDVTQELGITKYEKYILFCKDTNITKIKIWLSLSNRQNFSKYFL
jgi:RNA ligase (TIGR02306 family)